ncbi:hypothetical protein Q8G47_29550 [Klebsiella pneumoniae]|uniref:hypothetical protein n=1 Tax=Klebsiella pneumoniae TaxID=573 RepID=UPI0030131FFF
MTDPTFHLTRPLILINTQMAPTSWSWLSATPLYGATGTLVPVTKGDQTLTSLWPWYVGGMAV